MQSASWLYICPLSVSWKFKGQSWLRTTARISSPAWRQIWWNTDFFCWTSNFQYVVGMSTAVLKFKSLHWIGRKTGFATCPESNYKAANCVGSTAYLLTEGCARTFSADVDWLEQILMSFPPYCSLIWKKSLERKSLKHHLKCPPDASSFLKRQSTCMLATFRITFNV